MHHTDRARPFLFSSSLKTLVRGVLEYRSTFFLHFDFRTLQRHQVRWVGSDSIALALALDLDGVTVGMINGPSNTRSGRTILAGRALEHETHKALFRIQLLGMD